MPAGTLAPPAEFAAWRVAVTECQRTGYSDATDQAEQRAFDAWADVANDRGLCLNCATPEPTGAGYCKECR